MALACRAVSVPALGRILMLVVMAVDTQQLPVAAVRRIIPVVMILVVDRQFFERLPSKLAAAPSADVWK